MSNLLRDLGSLTDSAARAARAARRSAVAAAGTSGGSGYVAYRNHVPLTPLGKSVLAVGAALGALSDPSRADLVAAVSEATGGPAYAAALDKMRSSADGRWLLENRPDINGTVLASLGDLPDHTVGGAWAAFLGRRGFDADDRPAVRYVDSEDLAYVAQRHRETHDLWHVLFDCPTTVLGELCLKAVEVEQARRGRVRGTWR